MRKPGRLPLEALRPVLLEVPPIRPEISPETLPSLDGPALFGNSLPLEIEVGFGKGLFLLCSAAARKDTNFLGIEIEMKYVLLTANRLVKAGLNNVRVVGTDARDFFHRRLPDGTVQAVHIFFPDPWWKNKHRKRRLFTADFAGQVARVLKDEGRLHLVTDVEDYFQVMRKIVQGLGSLKELPPPVEKSPEHDMDYLTNFERKYRREGRPIWRALFEKQASEA